MSFCQSLFCNVYSVILGKSKNDWQDVDYVLKYFTQRRTEARKGIWTMSAKELRKYKLKARGYNLDAISDRVAEIFDVTPEEIFSPGKYKERVRARIVFSYWAVRELGETASCLARKIGISQPAVSLSVQRGERIVKEMGLDL